MRAEKRRQAEGALARLRSGEDFAALARELSEDSSKENGGDLGFLTREQMVPPFAEVAFSLPPGETSGIVETQFGFHIVRVEEKRPGQSTPLAEVREEIRWRLRREKASALRRERAGADGRRAAEGESLGALAVAAGLRLEAIGPLARGDPIPGVDRQAEVAEELFALSEGEAGDVVDGPDASYLLRVVEKIPARIPPFEEVRERVVEAARKERASDRARERAKALLEQLKQTRDIDAVAAGAGLRVEETEPFRRVDGAIPGLGSSADLQADAFALSPENPIAARAYDAGGDSVVVMLKERIPIGESEFAAEKERLRRRLQDQRKGAIIEAFTNHLKARAAIQVHPDYLATIERRPARSGS